jgi:hypothetical protein
MRSLNRNEEPPPPESLASSCVAMLLAMPAGTWRQRRAILDPAAPLPWSMHVGHIREAINDLLASFRAKLGVTERERDHEITLLAEAIIEHGRMTQKLYRNRRVVVDVKELAYRFREESQTITKALVLLGHQGRAKPTDLDGLWELRV